MTANFLRRNCVIACRSPMRKGDRWQHSPGLRRWRRQRHSLGSFGPWNKRGHRRSVLLRAQNRSPHAACRSPHSKSRHKLTPPPRCAAFVGVQASSSTAASAGASNRCDKSFIALLPSLVAALTPRQSQVVILKSVKARPSLVL
jgi:hypothetical protein